MGKRDLKMDRNLAISLVSLGFSSEKRKYLINRNYKIIMIIIQNKASLLITIKPL